MIEIPLRLAEVLAKYGQLADIYSHEFRWEYEVGFMLSACDQVAELVKQAREKGQ